MRQEVRRLIQPNPSTIRRPLKEILEPTIAV